MEGNMGNYQLLPGDAMDVLSTLPDRSVQCCVTSPPYFGLRDYGIGGQIGLEDTPDAFVTRLVDVFREVRRVLRDDGVLWVNIGDSYAGSGKRGNPEGSPWAGFVGNKQRETSAKASKPVIPSGCKPKDLIGIPWMLAFALRADGWYLRRDVVWHKPNPMPESVRDRPTTSHEYVFMLTKSSRYYYDGDAVREPLSEESKRRVMRGVSGTNKYAAGSERPSGVHANTMSQQRAFRGYEDMERAIAAGETVLNPKGRNRRSVWTIPTSSYREAHFATYPPALVEPCVLSSTSEKGACGACGAPYQRVVERVARRVNPEEARRRIEASGGVLSGGTARSTLGVTEGVSTEVMGWRKSCRCETDEVKPCVVLDPFNGAGTTGLVALSHGRDYIGIDLNPEYLKLTEKRYNDFRERNSVSKPVTRVRDDV